MALFKINRGASYDLPNTLNDGWAYFCTDDFSFHIDYTDENGVLRRAQLNAADAETLTGAALSTVLNSSATHMEIPTSKAVLTALSSYQTKLTFDSAPKANSSNPVTSSGVKTYVDNSVSTHNSSSSAHSDIRTLINDLKTKVNNFLDVSDTTTDQLSEVLTLINNNKGTLESLTTSKINVSDIVDNLTTSNAGKVLSAKQGVALKALIDALDGELDSHTHAIADVSGLQTALDGKAASSHGTHVSFTTTKPVMAGTASVGSASTVSRSDHKHPTDTSRAAKTDFDTHVADTTKHITATERTNWNTAHTHSQATHAPIDAQKNQNSFSNIAVSGQTTVAADSETDTVTFVGSNVSITTDATNDSVTFSVASGSTSKAGILKLTDSTSSTSTTTAATPKNVKSAYDLANSAKTKADSAYTLAEGKVGSLSELGVTATADKINYLSTVTSDVQTQLDGKSATDHTHKYAGSSSVGGAATSAAKLNTDAGSTTQPVYFSGGIPVKTTYTLGKSVPSDAVFTDTTYDRATTTADGLMSLEDKAKVNYTNVAYGTCSTAAGTAAKVVTISGNTQWALVPGSLITVLFSATNTASNPTLNVNGTGAKNIFYENAQIKTSNLAFAGAVDRPMTFMYDGTQYIFVSRGYDANTQSTTNSTNTSSKIFLVGATSQGSNKTTYSHDTAYVGTDGCLYSNSTKVSVEGHTHDYVSPDTLSAHTGNTSNPHSVTYSQVGAAPTAHASSATTYGIGDGSNYGHVKLSDSTSSTSAASAGIAASPKAVKSAYDAASGAQTTADSHIANKSNPHGVTAAQVGAAPTSHASSATTYGIGTGSNYGHVKISDSTSSTSAASSGIAASPKAVKAAYDLANTANNTVNSINERLTALEESIVTVHSGVSMPLDTVGEDGDIYLYTGE